MKTVIYVDGFNLYYGCLKGSGFKWLDLDRLCRLMLPQNEIVRIKYFSAKLSARPGDPGLPNRQELYFRALRTLPNVEIILGRFLQSEVRMVESSSPPGQPRFVQVRKTEEKGSDVNMAVHLVHDGHRGGYEVAVLITNDSDLIEAVRIVRSDLGLPVGILCPYRKPSVALRTHASFVRPIRAGALASSQFPPVLQDSGGPFHKPAAW